MASVPDARAPRAPDPAEPADGKGPDSKGPDSRNDTRMPKRARPRMISLTLLDGTSVQIPAPGRRPSQVDESERGDPVKPAVSDQLTARDLVSALRAVSHGVDASEILGSEPRWEALFSALLSVLLRKGIIADWEFIEEFRKL
jgi:hypothetical protein